MKLLVCLKQVPAKDAPLKLNSAGSWIVEDVSYEVSEPDAYALEEALRQKEAHGGEVTVITVGPQRAAQVLREALAKGADKAIHVEGDGTQLLDSFATAEAITRAIPGQHFDLILTGLQSDDSGAAQVGVILAELMGIPHATIIMQIEPVPGGVRVKRELEGGAFQYLEMPTPAVLTIQSGINKLRYATLMGIKQAKSKPLSKINAETDGISVELNRLVIERLYVPGAQKKTERITGTAKDAAARIASVLKAQGIGAGE